eukprot:6730086-Prymnesium_polylepis.1
MTVPSARIGVMISEKRRRALSAIVRAKKRRRGAQSHFAAKRVIFVFRNGDGYFFVGEHRG